MTARLLRYSKGLKKGQTYKVQDIGEMAYQGRLVRSVLLLKQLAQNKTEIVRVPLEHVELVPDEEGHLAPFTESKLQDQYKK